MRKTLTLPAAAAPNVCRDLPTGAQAEGAEITRSRQWQQTMTSIRVITRVACSKSATRIHATSASNLMQGGTLYRCQESGTAIPSNQQLCAGGWNMIGFPSLNGMSVADFGTAAIDGNFTMVWQWNSGWKQVSPPDSNNMIPGKGYLLWMTDDGVLPGMIT